MAHLPDTVPGHAAPSSSASSGRRDANDVTVPATPPVANARADPDAAPSSMDDAGMKNAAGSQQSAVSSTTDGAVSAAEAPHASSHTIPDSQESTTQAGPTPAPAAASDPKTAGGQHLLQLSAIAAAQERIDQDAAAGSRKRMANGQVKARSRSISPIKGHARSVSAISMASAGSHIGDMSADLKTRLAYAMMKVNHGWQSRSLEEVESLASQAASPVSSNSTLHRRQSSSTSPRPAATSSAQVHFAPDPVVVRRKSHSPPERSNKPTLAPPAPIQPSLAKQSSNSRRNPAPRHTPALLSHSHSASAATYSPRQHPEAAISSSQPTYSPHQNVREQDAIETLLFMSSPNNSANLKHTFSPSVSPAPQQGLLTGSIHRAAAQSDYRKGLPGQRPGVAQRRTGFDRSPAMGPPGSPMDLDSPQQPPYQSPNSWTPKRRANGATGHLRGALSLPSGLGIGNGRTRQSLRDEDIDRILDHAADDSSDDEEIQLPARANMAGAVGT